MSTEVVDVAVDGGQTALRLAVVSTGRHVVDAPGFSWQEDPETAVVRAVRDAWTKVCAGRPAPRVRRVFCGLTGWPSRPAAQHEVAASIAKITGAGEVVAGADMVSAHAGALPQGHGVVASVGTGVIALAVNTATARHARVDGWGYLLGDAGSAFAVGRDGLQAVFRARDGRGASTLLTRLAEERFGPVDTLPERLYRSSTTVADIADFAPAVLATAADDPISRAIVGRAAAELCRTIATATQSVDSTAAVPVSYAGRLLTCGTPLRDALRHRLQALPRPLELTPPAGGPLDGACRLAAHDIPNAYAPLVYCYRRP